MRIVEKKFEYLKDLFESLCPGNIGKIGNFIGNHHENVCHLNQIIEYEKLNIKVESKFEDNVFVQ